jgi:diguanylate cyclase (GGDEF)-like protein
MVGRSGAARLVWIACLVAGGLGATLFALVPGLALPVALVVGLGSVTAAFVGPRWQGGGPYDAWNLLGLGGAAYLAGLLLRPWAGRQTGVGAFVADIFTVPGYVLVIAALILLIPTHGLQRHAITDGLIVGVGAGLASYVELAPPQAGMPGTIAIYPVLDIALLLILINMAFTTAARHASFRFLVAATVLLLVGDLANAGVARMHAGRLANVPFILAFACVAAATTHPSVARLSRGVRLSVQPWSWRRLLLIAPAVLAPLTLLPHVASDAPGPRIAVATGGSLIVFLLLFRAVSAVQAYTRAQRRAEHQATHDELTGLPNRVTLIAEVDRWLGMKLGRGSHMWVLYLDIDDFKLVNDSWGHAAGDYLIAEAAQRLRSDAPAESIVARVGGDEFMIAWAADPDSIAPLADRLVACFATPFALRGVEAFVTASIGIGGVAFAGDEAGATAEDLLRDADTALYQAKSAGPGGWRVCDASMKNRVRERVEIEFALEEAISRDELRLVYQPIVELRSGRIVGAEALCRWSHPVLGEITPDVFMPVAEQAGLIVRLGRWTFDEGLRRLAEWRRRGVVHDDFWLSINVSPQQLRDAALPRVLSETVARHGVPARALVLEVTESVMVEPWTAINQVLVDLRASGVRLIVDDFGTGYSALGYLRRQPVTGVKIDRAFVAGLGVNVEDGEIARAVVAMADALGLSVVAEGVETPAQQEALSGMGVAMGQGHLWSRPLDPSEFEQRWSALVSPLPHP